MKHATPLAERFWPKVDRRGEEECWPWLACVGTNGYGRIGIGRDKVIDAHRASYLVTHGEIPDGLEIDHICHNRICVNPAHLRAVTRKQNLENRGPDRGSASGIRGVHHHNQNPNTPWEVRVGHLGRRYSGGLFSDLAEAEQAAIALRNKFFTHNNTDHPR